MEMTKEMQKTFKEIQDIMFAPDGVELAREQFVTAFEKEPSENELFTFICAACASMMSDRYC